MIRFKIKEGSKSVIDTTSVEPGSILFDRTNRDLYIDTASGIRRKIGGGSGQHIRMQLTAPTVRGVETINLRIHDNDRLLSSDKLMVAHQVYRKTKRKISNEDAQEGLYNDSATNGIYSKLAIAGFGDNVSDKSIWETSFNSDVDQWVMTNGTKGYSFSSFKDDLVRVSSNKKYFYIVGQPGNRRHVITENGRCIEKHTQLKRERDKKYFATARMKIVLVRDGKVIAESNEITLGAAAIKCHNTGVVSKYVKLIKGRS